MLPSLRPQAVASVICEFSRTDSSADYELIVVSPFPVAGERVVHVPETERRGVLFAMNRAYDAASGDYIVTWSDDALPQSDCLTRIVPFVRSHQAPFLACFGKRDERGRRSEQWSVYGRLYASWFCASRKTLEMMGGLWDPIFKNYWADPDLSLRVYERGGGVEVCEIATIRVAQVWDDIKSQNLSTTFESDTAAFFDRWHHKFGRGKKRVWTSINTPIPCSFGGQVRAVLRQIPYLRRIKRAVTQLVET